MNSNTLSAEIQELIRRLCLNDFPRGCSRSRDDGEDSDALLDLLRCPRSPWRPEDSWSPQAPALRQLAVLAPKGLHSDFIYKYFTVLRILDKGVCIIDDGLLKFSKLEELVLSANNISEIPAENLPSTLRILELRANRVSSLKSLTSCPPPRLQYLGLGSNCLGSREDICHLTVLHWPELVCLDLSDCDFEDQRALVNALSALPGLRTLMLQENPFTLSPSYPGFTVDSLSRLSYLDDSWIFPEQRRRFRGLAKMNDLILDTAAVTVGLRRMRGFPNPRTHRTNFSAAVTCRYYITYEFLSYQMSAEQSFDGDSKFDAAHVKEDDADLQSNKNNKTQTSKPGTGTSEELCRDVTRVLRHSTSKLAWSPSMDFNHTNTHIVGDLRGLKRFLNQGLHLKLEEETVLPTDSKDVQEGQSSQIKEKKGAKEKASASRVFSSKDNHKKSVADQVQEAHIRVLGSVHVPLQSLISRGQKVNICDFGVLLTEPEVETSLTPKKDAKTKEDKKNEDKELKLRTDSCVQQKNAAGPKGKGSKESQMDVNTEAMASLHVDPVTVEFSVELETWRSASDAHQLPCQTSVKSSAPCRL